MKIKSFSSINLIAQSSKKKGDTSSKQNYSRNTIHNKHQNSQHSGRGGGRSVMVVAQIIIGVIEINLNARSALSLGTMLINVSFNMFLLEQLNQVFLITLFLLFLLL